TKVTHVVVSDYRYRIARARKFFQTGDVLHSCWQDTDSIAPVRAVHPRQVSLEGDLTLQATVNNRTSQRLVLNCANSALQRFINKPQLTGKFSNRFGVELAAQQLFHKA